MPCAAAGPLLGGLGMVGVLALFTSKGRSSLFLVAALYPAEALPADDRTTGVGVYRTTSDVRAALAPLLLGWLVDQGGYTTALFATAALLLAAIGVFV